MSKKIEIINNAIVVTDTVSGLIVSEFPSRDIYFDTQDLEAVPSMVKLYDTNGVNEGSSGVWSALLADCVDSGLVPFTAASFRAFARVSLGFNIPPAPPPAAQDLQSVLNNGSTATISTAFAIALDSGNGIVLSEDIVGLEGEAKISAFGGGYGLGYVQLSFDDTISFGGVQSIRLDGINSSGIVVTEGANSRGLLYATDYSANYTIRSLVDKAYVDAGDTADTLAAVLAAGNSITANPIDVIAGGAGIIFKGNAFSTITADGATDGIVIGTAPNADFRLVSGAGGDIVISLPIVTTGEIQIGKNLGAFGIKISTAGLVLSDNVNSKGFVYTADYSAAGILDDRWIPDYGAVKAAIPKIGTAPVSVTSVVSSGTATAGFLTSTNNMVEYEIGGVGNGAFKILYYSVIVPEDYKSGGTININSWTTDFLNLTTWTVTGYIEGVVDTVLSAVSITPTADLAYELTSNNFADLISAGDVLQIKLDFTGSIGDDIRVNKVNFTYNR